MERDWGYSYNETGYNAKKRRRGKKDKDERPRKMYMERKLMIYSIETEIHFTSPVTKESMEELIHLTGEVLAYETEKDSDTELDITLTFIFDTPGGDLEAAFKFLDYLRMCQKKHKKLKTLGIVTGQVASAGTLICAFFDKCFMTKYASAMIHELSTGYGHTQYTHIQSRAERAKMLHNSLVDIYLERLKKSGKEMSREKIEALLKDETWCSADQYLEYGFIDEIK